MNYADKVMIAMLLNANGLDSTLAAHAVNSLETLAAKPRSEQETMLRAAAEPQVDLPTVIALGDGAHIISSGTYRGQPAIFLESTPEPREPGTRQAEGTFPADQLAKGAVIITSTYLRSLEVLREHVDKAAQQMMGEAEHRWSEAESFMIEAAMYYGFKSAGTRLDDQAQMYLATEAQIIKLMTEARLQGRRDVEEFQQQVNGWADDCFPSWRHDRSERQHRFLEEALELVQSVGTTREEAYQLVDYVFSRPAGEPAQEVGGVRTTLAAFCTAHDLNDQACARAELDRILQPDVMAKIRAKQAAKPKVGPLPGAAPRSEHEERGWQPK